MKSKQSNRLGTTILLALAPAAALGVTAGVVASSLSQDESGTLDWKKAFDKIDLYYNDSVNVTWKCSSDSESNGNQITCSAANSKIKVTYPNEPNSRWYEKINGIWMEHSLDDTGLYHYSDLGEGLLSPVDAIVSAISESTPTEKVGNCYKGIAKLDMGAPTKVDIPYQLFFSGDFITKIIYSFETEYYKNNTTCEFVNYGTTTVEELPAITDNNLFKGVQSGDQFVADLGNVTGSAFFSRFCLFDIRNQVQSNYKITFGGDFSKSILTTTGIQIYDFYDYCLEKTQEITEGFTWTGEKEITIDANLIKTGPILVSIPVWADKSWSNATVTLTGSDN